MKANIKRPHMQKFTFNSFEKDAVLDYLKEMENTDCLKKFGSGEVYEYETESGTIYSIKLSVRIMLLSEEFDVTSLFQSHLQLCYYLGEIAKRISYAYPHSGCFLQIIDPNTGAAETRGYLI